MQLELFCGDKPVMLHLPDSAHTIEMDPIPALADPIAAVREALANPIGSPCLEELAKGRKDACIVISDITRPVPNQITLPPIMEALEKGGIPRDKVTILIATGMHRPNLGAELESMVGREIMETCNIVNHFCRKEGENREIARIDGAPIEINERYLDADLKILTGLIEPHFYAGFSGGRKSILPGISSFETMKFMHSYRVIQQLDNVNCRLQGNLFHDYAMRVTELAGADFICNVVINRHRELAGVFAGHHDKAHLAGCELVGRHSVVELPHHMDLVVTSGGGYPLDSSFYQVSKALTCAKDVLEPGGVILVTCGCQEGLGNEEFTSIMRSTSTPEAFDKNYSRPEDFVIDQWCAQNIYQALEKAEGILIHSPGLSEKDVRAFGGVKVRDPQAILDELLPSHPRVAVFPEGPYAVGKVKE